MGDILQGITVKFEFPVCFTRNLFDPSNRVFVDSITRVEPEKRHQVLFVIDDNVAAANFEPIPYPGDVIGEAESPQLGAESENDSIRPPLMSGALGDGCRALARKQPFRVVDMADGERVQARGEAANIPLGRGSHSLIVSIGVARP